MPFHLTTSMSLWPARRGLFLRCATVIDLVVAGRLWIDIRGMTFEQPRKYNMLIEMRDLELCELRQD